VHVSDMRLTAVVSSYSVFVSLRLWQLWGRRRQRRRACREQGILKHVPRAAVALSAATGSAAVAWSNSWARRDGAGGTSWRRLAEMKEVGVDVAGEQATGVRTALTITICAEKRSRPVGRSFPLIARGLLPNFSFLVGNFYGNFSRISICERHMLFFSGFTVSFFIVFHAKSLRPHGPRRLFFLLGTWGLSGAEGRARLA
jgi:hypothetical protein